MLTFNTKALTTPSKLVYCDFETQSVLNLKSVGEKVYIEDPSTRVMSAVFKCGNELIVWAPKSRLPAIQQDKCFPVLPGVKYTSYTTEDVPKIVVKWIEAGHTFVAHNAELFDAWLFEEKYPHVKQPQWIDTLHLAHAAGLPGKYNGLLHYVTGKVKADDTAMLLLTKAKTDGNGNPVYMKATFATWQKLIKYNIADVYDLDAICKWFGEHINPETDVIRAHGEINQRGFKVNRRLLRELRKTWTQAQNECKDEIEELTGGMLKALPNGKHDISSPAKVKAWLATLGFTLPADSLNNAIVNQILANPENYVDDDDDGRAIVAMLALRQQAVRSVVGKLDRITNELSDDDCIRRTHVYHGAHTGRDSSRGVQTHNFPRGVSLKKSTTGKYDGLYELLTAKHLTLEAVRAVALCNSEEGKKPVSMSDVLSTLTRSIIEAREGHELHIFDYMAVEARGVTYLSDCGPLLDVFNDPRGDAYCLMSSRLYGRTITKADKDERFVGKQIVLGCGYQMGADKFALSCKVFLVDLDKAGVTAAECVTAYRKAFPEIPKLWKAYQTALHMCVRDGWSGTAGKCHFRRERGWLVVTIPSGRELRYREPRMVKRVAPWNPNDIIDAVEYTNGHGFTRGLYGGKLTENIVQAMCRDIMFDAVLRTHSIAPVILRVHDELVYECPKKGGDKLRDKLGVEMSKPPKWAPDFPLGVEGYRAAHYTKGAYGKNHEKMFLTGVAV